MPSGMACNPASSRAKGGCNCCCCCCICAYPCLFIGLVGANIRAVGGGKTQARERPEHNGRSVEVDIEVVMVKNAADQRPKQSRREAQPLPEQRRRTHQLSPPHQ